MQIHIINGPNLNNIGIREPNIYGNVNFSSYLKDLRTKFNNIKIKYSNSHSESDIVKLIHESNKLDTGIILNAGAYTHNSVAIRDAIASIKIPVILVHISNVYAREPFRKQNVIAPACKGIITGFGLKSYEIAIKSFIE